jgi:hypothetical protein
MHPLRLHNLISEETCLQKKRIYYFELISKNVCRLYKSDRSTQKTYSREEAAYATDDQEVSFIKVTIHAWHADTCEEKGATHSVST